MVEIEIKCKGNKELADELRAILIKYGQDFSLNTTWRTFEAKLDEVRK